IETVEPSEELKGWIEADWGNDNTYAYRGAAGGPLVGDTLLGRIAVSKRHTDGTFTNVNTGVDVQRYEDLSAYGVLRYRPSDTLTVDLRIGNTSIDGAGTAFVAQLTAEGYDANDASRPFESDLEGFQGQDIATASLKVDAEIGAGTLTYSIASYDMDRHYSIGTIPYRYYPAGLSQYQFRTYQSLSHELQLTSNDDGALQWIVGAFYADIDTRTANVVTTRPEGVSTPELKIWPADSPWPTLAYADDAGHSDAYAVYGNLSYNFSDALQAVVSLRYDSEERTRTDVAYGWSPNPGEFVEKTWSELQPKASISYAFSDGQMIYATVGRGFKSGGFNPTGTAASMRQFNPDSTIKDIVDASVVDSVEVGYKAMLLDQRLRFSLAGFYQTIENAQSFEYNLALAFNGISTAKEGRVKGVEVEAEWAVTNRLTLAANYGLQDSELTDFPDDRTLEGNWLPNVPRNTGNVGGQWQVPLSGGWTASARVNYRIEGARYFNWPNTPGTKRDSVDLLDAQFAIRNDRFSFMLWGKNLTDELYFDDYVPVIPIAGAAYKAPLRTYGLKVRCDF
ncbi:MAG: TonB-dependent receptor, partial [Proteobacteria bacterium]|nr:TonB-dependent receptor [Pseudomonadota bacterium]